MKKSIAVLGMANLSVQQRIEKARYIITSVTGNANFPTLATTLPAITTSVNNLETASIAAKSGGKDETAIVKTKTLTLDLAMKALCSSVETIANNNLVTADSVILSAGFNLRKQPVIRSGGFRVTQGKNPGEIEIRTDAETRTFYTFEMTLTPDDEASWTEINSGTKSRYLATGLESGRRYYFRVAKTNKGGTGPWSNVLNAIVA